MPAHLDFLFYGSRAKDTYMPMHQHHCYELVYYVEGTGLTRLDHTEYSYMKNTYAIIPPGMSHDETRVEDTHVIFIGFSLINHEFLPLEPGLFTDSPNSSILDLLLDMKAEMQTKTIYFTQKLNMRTSEIVIEHLRTVTTTGSNDKDDNLLYIRTFMEENYNQKISIQELADMAGYSYHHFRHLFKKNLGISPFRFLLNKRLEKARNLLRHTELPITSIAMECGFSNNAQFCMIFKREFNETPRSFRLNAYRNTLRG